MAQDAELALALARTVAHELGNLLQPLATVLRYVDQAPPAERSSHLEMVADAVRGCQVVAERLRTASVVGSAPQAFALSEALEEAHGGLAAELRSRVNLPPAISTKVTGDRGAAVMALTHLMWHAAQVVGTRSTVDVEAGPPVIIRFGPPSPVRDDAATAPITNSTVARMSSAVAMGWVLSSCAFGPNSLRMALGIGSGRFELRMPEAGGNTP
jgi:hypothetical protein